MKKITKYILTTAIVLLGHYNLATPQNISRNKSITQNNSMQKTKLNENNFFGIEKLINHIKNNHEKQILPNGDIKYVHRGKGKIDNYENWGITFIQTAKGNNILATSLVDKSIPGTYLVNYDISQEINNLDGISDKSGVKKYWFINEARADKKEIDKTHSFDFFKKRNELKKSTSEEKMCHIDVLLQYYKNQMK